jgi:hypothetical protein
MSMLNLAKSIVVVGMFSQSGAQHLRGSNQSSDKNLVKLKDERNPQQLSYRDGDVSGDTNLVSSSQKSQLNITEVSYQSSESFLPSHDSLHDCDYTVNTSVGKFESMKGKCNEDGLFVSGMKTTDKGYVMTGDNFDSNGKLHGIGHIYYGLGDEEYGVFDHGVITDGVIDVSGRHTEGHYNKDRRLDDKGGKEITQTSSGNLRVNTGDFSNGKHVSGSSENFGNDNELNNEFGWISSIFS